MLRILLMERHMNAIDDQDNLVGFSTYDDCCAHGGWFVSDEIIKDSSLWTTKQENKEKEYPDYIFDTTFFEDLRTEERDDTNCVVFSFKSYSNKPLYLHLFNCHNGYYSKGFCKKFGGVVLDSNL